MAVIDGRVVAETARSGASDVFDNELQHGPTSDQLNAMLFAGKQPPVRLEGTVVMEGPFANWVASTVRGRYSWERPANYRGVSTVQQEVAVDQREEPGPITFTHPRLPRSAGALATRRSLHGLSTLY